MTKQSSSTQQNSWLYEMWTRLRKLDLQARGRLSEFIMQMLQCSGCVSRPPAALEPWAEPAKQYLSCWCSNARAICLSQTQTHKKG